MRALTHLIAIAILLPAAALARLGETEQQLSARYGAPVETKTKDGLKQLTFNFGQYYILAHCRNGRSVIESAYLKKREADLQEHVALAIASQVAGATNWEVIASRPFLKLWGVKDRQLCAMLMNEPGKPQSITVSTKAEFDRFQSSPEKLAPGF